MSRQILKLKDLLEQGEVALVNASSDIETLFTSQEFNNILNQNSIRALLNKASDYYRSKVYGVPVPVIPIQPKVSPQQEGTVIERLQNLEDQVSQLQQVFKNIAQTLNIFKEVDSRIKLEENEQIVNTTDNVVTPTNIDSEQHNDNNYLPTDTNNNTVIQKVINYIETQKELLENQYHKQQIIDDSDDLGKLMTITEAFKTISNLEIDHLRLGNKKIPEHLVIRTNSINLCIGFLQVNSRSFTPRITNYNTLVITHKDTKFILWRDSRKPPITSRGGKEEIEMLNNAPNGSFLTMERDNRINFELIYKLIVDIQNRDLEIPLEAALPMISSYLNNYWLIENLL